MTLGSIIAALLIFTVIVVIHEFGHFLLAKKNGVGVPEFSVGMGPRIITVAKTPQGMRCRFLCSQSKFDSLEEWRDVTKYSWKLFPLGGSCAMVGEDEDNDSEDSFNTKGVWARFSIIFAGPFFNFILAFVFSVIIIAHNGIDIPLVRAVYEHQPAQTAGIQEGDIIKEVDGKKITIGREIDTHFLLHPLTGEDVEVVVERDGETKTLTIDPHYTTYLFGFTYGAQATSDTKIAEISKDRPFEKAGLKSGDKIKSVNGRVVTNGEELGNVMSQENVSGDPVTFVIEQDGQEKTFEITPEPNKSMTLGFFASADESIKTVLAKPGQDVETVRVNPIVRTGYVLKYSVIEVKYWIETTVASLGQLIRGKLSKDDISGPVGIVNAVGGIIDQTADYGKALKKSAWKIFTDIVMNMLYMAVLLSANLGIMNLLPLPALDGGRLVFILIEAVRGKPIDPAKEGYVHFAGFVVLMLFMVFVMYNDILRIIH